MRSAPRERWPWGLRPVGGADRREVVFNAESGEDPSDPRALLAETLARSYRRLGAEQTLFDMLHEAVRKDEAALAAVRRGMRYRPR